MSLVAVLLAIAVIVFVLWAINKYAPAQYKNVLYIIVFAIVVLWLLQLLGIFHLFEGIWVGHR